MTSVDPWAPREDIQPKPQPRPESQTAQNSRENKPARKPRIPDEPSTAKRSSGIAANGVALDPNRYPHRPLREYPESDELLSYVPDAEIDYSDIRDVNRSMNIARARLFRATQMLKDAQRAEADAKYEWKSALNRAIVVMSGGTERTRQAMAEIQTEEEYSKFLVASRVSEEALNFLRATRGDLEALQNLSHNLRAQMQVM